MVADDGALENGEEDAKHASDVSFVWGEVGGSAD